MGAAATVGAGMAVAEARAEGARAGVATAVGVLGMVGLGWAAMAEGVREVGVGGATGWVRASWAGLG
jgi:hypothetical protein